VCIWVPTSINGIKCISLLEGFPSCQNVSYSGHDHRAGATAGMRLQDCSRAGPHSDSAQHPAAACAYLTTKLVSGDWASIEATMGMCALQLQHLQRHWCSCAAACAHPVHT
jgi:hypothetical protein